MTNTGIEYELFVQNIYQALLNSEEFSSHKNITVEQNRKIIDIHGIERQFDIYWEYELGGLKYKNIIECKDYKNKVGVEKIDALVGKLLNFHNIRGILATREGFQSGAKNKADSHGIELLIIRNHREDDWIDTDGSKIATKAKVRGRIYLPIEILSFSPVIDKSWLEAQGKIDEHVDLDNRWRSDEVYIEDIDLGERYSYQDIVDGKVFSKGEKPNLYLKTKEFNEAYLKTPSYKHKIKKLTIEYEVKNPVSIKADIDFEDYVLGIIEYLSTGHKKIIVNPHPK